jgi:CDP-paratose 2-epimerase
LKQLSNWCRKQIGPGEVPSSPEIRPFDLPWIVLDASLASVTWNWKPTRQLDNILEEILRHAKEKPDWLELSNRQ